MIDPFVLENFVDRGSFTGIVVENLGDKIAGSLRDIHVVWEVVGVHPNALVGSFHVTSFKRRLSDDQRVQNHTN